MYLLQMDLSLHIYHVTSTVINASEFDVYLDFSVADEAFNFLLKSISTDSETELSVDFQ